MYGDSEVLLGEFDHLNECEQSGANEHPGTWFKQNPGKREQIFLATKFANCVGADGSRYVDSSPEYCRKALEKSLSRLQLPHVDLYYAHRLDGKTPIEKTMEELKKLKQEGKIKHIGLSECSSDSLRRACKVEHVDAVQIEYSYVIPETPSRAMVRVANRAQAVLLGD